MTDIGRTTQSQREAMLQKYRGPLNDKDNKRINSEWYTTGEAPHEGACYVCNEVHWREDPETRVYTLAGHTNDHDVCHGCLAYIIVNKEANDTKCYGAECGQPISYGSLEEKIPLELIERYKYLNGALLYPENAAIRRNTALNIFQRQFLPFAGTQIRSTNTGYGGNGREHTECPIMCPYCLKIETMYRKNFGCKTAIHHSCDRTLQSRVMRAKYPKVIHTNAPLEGNFCLVCGRPSAKNAAGHGEHYDRNLETPALVPGDAACPVGLLPDCGGREELIARALGAQAKAQEQQTSKNFTNSYGAHEERILAANAAAFDPVFLAAAEQLIRENPWMKNDCDPSGNREGGRRHSRKKQIQKKRKTRKTRRHR